MYIKIYITVIKLLPFISGCLRLAFSTDCFTFSIKYMLSVGDVNLKHADYFSN